MAHPSNQYTGSEVLPPPSSAGASKALVPAPTSTVSTAAPLAGPTPAGGDVLHGGFNQQWLYHCLRRRWLMALLLGALAAGVAAGLLWWAFPESSRTVAYLQVTATPPEDPLSDRPTPVSARQIELFANSQAALIKSPDVLRAALAPPAINQLEAVKAHQPDPVQWLIEDLRVSYPNEGEILEVRYDGEENPEEMVRIVNAVIKSFMDNVIGKKAQERRQVHAELVTMHNQIENELQDMMQEYSRKIESFGGQDSGSAQVEITMLTNSLRNLENQMAAAEKELGELEVNMRVAMQAANSPAAEEAAIAAALDSDPTVANYQQELYSIDQRIRELSSVGKNPNSPELKRLYGIRQDAQRAMSEYQAQAEQQLRQEFRSKPNETLQTIILEYQLRKKSLTEELERLRAELEDKETRLIQTGARDPDLERLRMEIEQESEIERMLEMKVRSHDLTSEYDRQQVSEMHPAAASENINWIERIAIATIGGLGAFALACYGVALIDFRRRRLNTPTDVDEGLGLRVLGVLPSITNRKALAGTSVAAAQTAEGIDNVRAVLMHDATTQRRQVVLVTSSGTMEGASTVATQLAVSLAKAGRRTLLLDGDLRSPSLHSLLGLPLEDGFSEVLRSEIDLADAVHPTDYDQLYVLTAGVSDAEAVHALATDLPQPIFEKLRAEFDFVVIDSAPALGLADTVSLGQYADGAVLAVLRDHSELGKVNKTTELLRRMGIALLGSVVGGVPMKADRRMTRLLKSRNAQQRKLPAAAKSGASSSSNSTPHDAGSQPTDDLDDLLGDQK